MEPLIEREMTDAMMMTMMMIGEDGTGQIVTGIKAYLMTTTGSLLGENRKTNTKTWNLTPLDSGAEPHPTDPHPQTRKIWHAPIISPLCLWVYDQEEMIEKVQMLGRKPDTGKSFSYR